MKNILNNHLNDIVTKYRSGTTINQLSKEYKCNKKTIYSLFKINGIPFKTKSEIHRKYPIKENFMDKVDCEEKAYFLGLMYADGCNHIEKKYCCVTLVESDKDVLIALSNIIQPTKPLLFINGKNTKQDCYRMSINSPHFSKKMEELGCTARKTFILKFPTEEQVPNHLVHHFIRGYFDGDGCINNGKKRHFSFTGTEEFIDGIQDVLVENLGFSKTKVFKRFPERNNNIVTLLKCGRKQSLKFYNWLYKDATIFFQRKKDIFETYKT